MGLDVTHRLRKTSAGRLAFRRRTAWRRPLPPVARIQLLLDDLVAKGLLEARMRPDGLVGYHPTDEPLPAP
jgi:hypothetical protein